MNARMKRRTLVDLLERNLERDPGDAPAVYLEADVMADDMARYAPEAEESAEQPRDYGRQASW